MPLKKTGNPVGQPLKPEYEAIGPTELIRLLNSGNTWQQIAKHFGVEKDALRKAVTRRYKIKNRKSIICLRTGKEYT